MTTLNIMFLFLFIAKIIEPPFLLTTLQSNLTIVSPVEMDTFVNLFYN